MDRPLHSSLSCVVPFMQSVTVFRENSLVLLSAEVSAQNLKTPKSFEKRPGPIARATQAQDNNTLGRQPVSLYALARDLGSTEELVWDFYMFGLRVCRVL